MESSLLPSLSLSLSLLVVNASSMPGDEKGPSAAKGVPSNDAIVNDHLRRDDSTFRDHVSSLAHFSRSSLHKCRETIMILF